MLAEQCAGDQPEKKTRKLGYTEDDLKSFLASSTIKSVDLVAHSTAQLFQRFIDATFEIEELTLAELIDHYHLGILMQSYKPLDTDCMGYRSELLDAVCKLSIDLPPDCIEYIGTVLCDRFVIGTGMERVERVVQMQRALTMLIIKNDFSRQIAMSILLAIFAKVSGMPRNNTNIDIISEVFEMVKLIDWMQL
ncbi:GH10064, partial [Drosophila grimshawi]